MTNTNVEPLSLIGDDGNVVDSNDSHLVVVEVNGEHVLSSRVDDAEEMLLAGLDGPQSVLALAEIWEGVGTIEQVIPRAGGTGVSNTGVLSCSGDSSGVGTEDIVDHDRTHVDIVVGSGRAVNDHGSTDTITKLGHDVRVVPASSVLVERERVDTGVTWSNGTFTDTWNTVLVVPATLLVDTVPMDCGGVVLHAVGNTDLESITPVALYQRTWYLAVDGKSHAVETVKVEGGVGDVPLVCAYLTSCWPGVIVVRVDAKAIAPLASITGIVARVLTKSREGLGDVACAGTPGWASAVGAGAVAAATTPVTPSRVGRGSCRSCGGRSRWSPGPAGTLIGGNH